MRNINDWIEEHHKSHRSFKTLITATRKANEFSDLYTEALGSKATYVIVQRQVDKRFVVVFLNVAFPGLVAQVYPCWGVA